MAGHSHWKQIKEHKGTADQKRGVLFSKLVRSVSAAAKQEPNPSLNPRLRAAIEQAKKAKVPVETIDRAILRASEEKDLEFIVCEAYGPGGAALLISALTDNRNRTISEIKTALKETGGKWAEPGSVRWAFEETEGEFHSKFSHSVSSEDFSLLLKLIASIETLEDVENVSHNSTPLLI